MHGPPVFSILGNREVDHAELNLVELAGACWAERALESHVHVLRQIAVGAALLRTARAQRLADEMEMAQGIRKHARVHWYW